MLSAPAPLTIVVPDLFDTPGGIARIAQALIMAAVRWADARGRGVAVLALHDSGAQRVVEVCPPSVDYRGYRSARPALARDALSLAFAQRRVPFVFCHVNLAPLGLATLARGGRFAIVAHGLEVWLPQSRTKRFAMRASEAVWPVSHYTADVLEQRGVLRSQLTLIRNCVDPRRPIAREVAPPPDEAPRFVAVSRLSLADRDKGVDRAIEAFALALPRLPAGAALDIVGTGDDCARLEALAQTSGAGCCVRFHGRLDDAAVDALLDGARAMLLPSLTEGFGLAFVEAMARGRAVIAARARATPEVVGDGVTGILVQADDRVGLAHAVALLGNDRALAGSLGAAGHARVVEHFTFERYAREVAAALDRLCE